jgi:DNA-binding IclR family transcriptional regulator
VIPGTHVLAVPVFDDRERPVAAISINAMANRLPVSRARQLVPMLVEQAAGIGRQYGMLGKNRRD